MSEINSFPHRKKERGEEDEKEEKDGYISWSNALAGYSVLGGSKNRGRTEKRRKKRRIQEK